MPSLCSAPSWRRRLALGLALPLLCVSLACHAQKCGAEKPLDMPPGVDLPRLKLLDSGKRMAIYVAVAEADMESGSKRRLPKSMEGLVDLSNSQLLRMFTDAVKSSRRFAVFDSKATLTNEFSSVLVDLQVTMAKQTFPQIEPTRRVIASTVATSVGLADMLSGEDVLGDAIVEDGRTGVVGNNRRVLTSADDMKSEEVRQMRGDDYLDALRDAFFNIRIAMESRLRPLAKVIDVDGCDVGLIGGRKNGFERDDQLVVFRAKQVTLPGGGTTLASTRPVALIDCKGVGTDSSQCKVVQSVPGYKPAVDDYAVLNDASLQRSRER